MRPGANFPNTDTQMRCVMTDKTAFDHVSDWFKILLKSGVPALLIGLGWVSLFFGSFLLGSAWTSNPGFWIVAGSGLLMVVLGYRLYKDRWRTRCGIGDVSPSEPLHLEDPGISFNVAQR